MRILLSSIGSLFLVAALAGSGICAGDEAVIAKIGDRKITLSEFKRIIDYFDVDRQKMLESNPQLKETVLKQFVQSIVISDLAKEKGFDKNKEIKEQLQFFSDNFIANEYLKREVAAKISISDDELKTYYDTHAEEFKTPEMVKARHILVKVDASAPDDDKKKAREKADSLLKKIKEGEDFAKLASDVSDDPGSKSRGGDLGFFPKGRMVKPFEDAAFALNVGDVSGIVETQFGYHIIKVEEKKEAATEPFDAVKERLKQRLLQERTRKEVADFIEKAMRDAKTELFPDALTGEKQ